MAAMLPRVPDACRSTGTTSSTSCRLTPAASWARRCAISRSAATPIDRHDGHRRADGHPHRRVDADRRRRSTTSSSRRCMIEHGDIVAMPRPTSLQGRSRPGRCGAASAMMTTSSLSRSSSKPKVHPAAPSAACWAARRAAKTRRRSADIELPMQVFVIGIPIVGLGAGRCRRISSSASSRGSGALAMPLVFVFSLIAVNSTGLTSITPIGALGKLTQLTFGVLAPRQHRHQPHDRRHHRRGRAQRRQPAHGHQARLHAGRQAAAAGRRPRAGHPRGRAGGRAGLLCLLPRRHLASSPANRCRCRQRRSGEASPSS